MAEEEEKVVRNRHRIWIGSTTSSPRIDAGDVL